MWREALASYPLRRIASEGRAWESEQSEMLIYPRQPAGTWQFPDIFCPTLPPPPITVSLKGAEDVYAPHYIMTANEFESVDVSGIEADHDGRPSFLVPYPATDYHAAMSQTGAHYPLMGVSAPSPFQDGDHVSPVVSPQASFPPNRWVPTPYPQTAYTWPPACQTSTFTGGDDYQTPGHPALADLSFRYHNNWGFANGPTAIPTDSAMHTSGQTAFPNPTTDGSIYHGGSFSSSSAVSAGGGSFSSTFSSSLGDNVYFPEAYPPRAFHNTTPFDRVIQEQLSSTPPSPENYFASSAASSPTTMPQAATDSEAAVHSSSEIGPSRSRKKASSSSKNRKKLPSKPPHRGRHTRKRSSPPPPTPKPAVVGKGRPIAPAPPPSATPRHGKNTRSNSTLSTTMRAEEAAGSNQTIHFPPRAPRQAQLRPALPPSPAATAAPAAFSPEDSSPEAVSPAPTFQAMATATRHWSYEDRLLVQHRQAGMGYSQIKERCGFKEAVSTLRGRYRTLTKPKEARVRKPAWTERDLHLLEQAVHAFATGPDNGDQSTAKIPWMRVAAYIRDNGGYHFGNSTCRKRWDEMLAARSDRR